MRLRSHAGIDVLLSKARFVHAEALEARLLDAIEAGLGDDHAYVCFSGGVDSTVVLAACVRANKPTTALMAVSPSLPAAERAEAWRVAVEVNAPLIELFTKEIDLPEYQANTGNRCYYCKRTLYEEAMALASSHVEGSGRVLNGTHCDDLGEHRPGHAAAREKNVVSPLVAAHFGKCEVRALARYWRLSNASKPAMPCLASRIPTGVEVTAPRLRQVEDVELFLRGRGIWPARARWRERGVVIEVPPDLLGSASDPLLFAELKLTCARVGFEAVSVVARTALVR